GPRFEIRGPAEMLARPNVKRPVLGMRSPIQYLPPQLCALYHLPTNLAVPANNTGNVWVISLGGGFTQADIGKAFQAYGQTAPNIKTVSIGGANNAPGSDADIENLLDIQIAASTYTYCNGHQANIVFCSCPNTLEGFTAAVQAAANDPTCLAVSISWGSAE